MTITIAFTKAYPILAPPVLGKDKGRGLFVKVTKSFFKKPKQPAMNTIPAQRAELYLYYRRNIMTVNPYLYADPYPTLIYCGVFQNNPDRGGESG